MERDRLLRSNFRNQFPPGGGDWRAWAVSILQPDVSARYDAKRQRYLDDFPAPVRSALRRSYGFSCPELQLPGTTPMFTNTEVVQDSLTIWSVPTPQVLPAPQLHRVLTTVTGMFTDSRTLSIWKTLL